jgi:hypothetical protein
MFVDISYIVWSQERIACRIDLETEFGHFNQL